VKCHRLDKLEQMNERALVLGGGGVAGIAWTTGLLFGLSEQGVDLRDAELIVGTSAGGGGGAPQGRTKKRGVLV
jgi:NTE family protein